MPNEFETAARNNGCKITTQFSQVELLKNAAAVSAAVDDPSGICWGLSFVWMEYKAKDAYKKFFEDVNAWKDKATMLKAAGLYRIVQLKSDRIEHAAATCGLKPARDKEGDIKRKIMLRTSDFEDMKTLANWLAAAMGTRFFLIESDGHAMAASGSKTGKLEFFDPNFGVVSAWSASSMAKFFHEFFQQKRIRDNYWRRNSVSSLTITKFKKN